MYSGRDYPDIDCTEATQVLSKPFPPECELKEIDNGLMVNYTLIISELLRKGCAYQEPGSKIQIISPPDEVCFFKCLAHLAYKEHHNLHGCHQAYSAALATRAEGTQGHHITTITLVAQALRISVMTLENFKATTALIKEDNLDKKNLARGRTPVFPCIVLHNGHACLAVLQKSANKKLFSFKQLEEAFYSASQSQSASVAEPVENNAEIKAKKLAKKIEKQNSNFAKEKERLRKKIKESRQKKSKTEDPIVALQKQIHFCIRR